MECKSIYDTTKSATATGFNRYIVECKLKSITNGIWVLNRFNRYIVECKYKWVNQTSGFSYVLIDT